MVNNNNFEVFGFYSDYIIFFVFVCVSFILSFFLSLLPFWIGTQTTILDSEKISVYECGFDPLEYADTLNLDIKFYTVLILFLVFDIEIIFLLPWAVYFKAGVLGMYSYVFFWSGFIFMFILLIGLLYEYSNGLLDW